MMSTFCSKHAEPWNKYIGKERVKVVINQNYVEMHGQQNIEKYPDRVGPSGRFVENFTEPVFL
jgi:hypothetical protein